ncbi:sulfite exporter TauE/SafE family protein [Hasllibacter sp. MH4015]|uniref:sulfite exporter TauE/SafE family protein n=1 Tax=Hasllibacter sp. MH4015 TaxID=2854029 RepID=UPI001CD68580|nr:sulfite exporter TauE/SafE family protein [Hasllibacter sp. MH4015]
MINDVLSLMPVWAFLAALAISFGAGLVKGITGFGLPLIVVTGLSLFLDPLLAVAGVILPAVFSNVFQVLRHSRAEIADGVRDFWRYILIVCVVILLVTQVVTLIPIKALYLALGIPVLAISLVQLSGLRFTIPPHRRRVAEWGVGGLAGVLGGLTGSWGAPTVLYLLALDTPKARQMLVQGIVYSLGAISLFAGHLNSGLLTWTTATFSAALLLPVFLGMKVGYWLGDRLDQDRFRKITLIVLVLAGASLIRRGLFG